MRRAGLALVAVCAASAALASPAQAAGRCGPHAWCNTSLPADERAGLLLGALTRDEKISLLAGDDQFGVTGAPGTHTGTSNGIPRVGLPTTYYSDGPVGPRSGRATSMPSPIGLAATFDRSLARLHGRVVAREVRAKGNDVVFAPTVNLMRTPLGGRTFESFGEDPYMQTRMGVEWIKASQAEGVIGNVKHYAVNNQEGTPPGTLLGGTQGSRQTVNAVVDERTLREMYLPHFEAAVKEANVGSVMCAYNRVNGQYACENKHLLEDVLRGDWGFRGYVLADYGAARPTGTAASLNNGLDFEPWPGIAYSPAQVKVALATGLAPESVVDQHVRRILRTLFAYGFFDRAAYPYDDSRIDQGAHALAARQIEERSIVMLKNAGVLPLRGRSLALIGPDADTFKSGGGSSNVQPFAAITPRQGIERRAALAGVRVSYATGEDAAQAAEVARAAETAVVVVADTSSEGTDKPCMGLSCGTTDGVDRDALIERVAAANPRTIVVLETGAPVLTPWRDRVEGIVEAWYPGLQGGAAIARVLFGDVDPGGRLPATFPRREADEPYSGDREAYPGVLERVVYKEGVFVGYRWFDEKGIEPAFPFGHGLSYARFRYRNIRVSTRRDGSATVAVDVKNVGRRTGWAAPQLYLGMPEPGRGVRQPPRVLRGFQKVAIRRGRTRTVRFRLVARDFAYWSTPADDWRVARGCYRVEVGASSRDIRLRDAIGRGGALCPSNRSCLARRAPIGPRNIGRVRLGRTKSRLARLPGLSRRSRRTQRFCVKGRRGSVTAVFSKRGRARLVLTTAPSHGNRGVRPGVRTGKLRRAYRRRRAIGGGAFRANPRSPRLVGVRRGRVRYIAVADRRLLRKRRSLRAYLRLAKESASRPR